MDAQIESRRAKCLYCRKCKHRWKQRPSWRAQKNARPAQCPRCRCRHWDALEPHERIERTAEEILQRSCQRYGAVWLRMVFEVRNPAKDRADPRTRELRAYSILPRRTIQLCLRSPGLFHGLASKIAELITYLEREGQFPILYPPSPALQRNNLEA